MVLGWVNGITLLFQKIKSQTIRPALQLIVWRGKAYMVLAVESNNDNVNSTLVINFANVYCVERLIIDLLKCSSGSFTGSH